MVAPVNIFSLAPARIGGVDMLVPLFAEIRQMYPEAMIEIIFLETRIAQELSNRAQLKKDVHWASTRCTRLNWDDIQGGRVCRALKLFRILPLLLRILVVRKPVLIHSRMDQTGVVEILGRCVRLKGGAVLGHPHMQTVFFGRSNELSQKIRSNINGWLAFGTGEGSVRPQFSDDVPIHIMGYTKLYPAWQKYLRVLSVDLLSRIIRESNSMDDNQRKLSLVFGVFSGSVVDEIYSEEDLRVFFDEVFGVLSKHYPGSQVLVKRHPMERSDVPRESASNASGLNVHFVDDHPGVVAASSSCIIATHTSAVIDSLGVGIPTILHHKFSSKWMKRHPERSSFLSLGIPHSTNSKTLKNAIDVQLGPKCVIPDIREILGHRVDLSVFAEKARRRRE